MDGAGRVRFEIIQFFVKFCAQFLFIFLNLCINIVTVGSVQFVEADFIIW